MDESLQNLEAELKSLRLQRPAPPLLERIEHDLAAQRDESAAATSPRYTAATNLNSWKWLGWQTAGVAAALALVATVSFMVLRRPVASAPASPPAQLARANPEGHIPPANAARIDQYQPVAATNVFYDLKDEGPVDVDGTTSARRYRYRYLDTYTWKNPRNNASLKWSVPRDEIRVLPASLN